MALFRNDYHCVNVPYSSQYFVFFPPFCNMELSLLSSDAIVLLITCIGTDRIVAITLAVNSLKVSAVMLNFLALFRKSSPTILNIFSIGFKSGLRGGMGKSTAFISRIAAFATALFWLGSPSWTNKREPCLFALAKVASNLLRINSAKYCPFNFFVRFAKNYTLVV